MVCNVRLRLKKLKSEAQQCGRVEVSRLTNEKTRQSYSAKLAKHMESIGPTDDLEDYSARISKAIRSAVESTVPAKRATKKHWISEETPTLVDERQ